MAKKPRDPFDLPLNDDQRKALGLWLVQELNSALDAKGAVDTEVDYWHQLYEQARTRSGRSAPWPNAADLTSYLASEKVDAIHARILRTVWTEPVWTVEGWGDAADRAPFVEEFHQWKAEEERLQSVLDRLALICLIEPRGLLEVSEGTDTRIQRQRINAKVETNPLGGLQFDEKGQPQLAMGPDGKYADAGAQDLSADTVVDSNEPVRSGPEYRILPYRDSVILPGHARDKKEIRGYGKRFWRLYPELERQSQGPNAIYDAEAVRLMTTVQDKEPDAALQRSRQGVQVAKDKLTAEKELWEVTLLLDLNALLETYNESTLGSEYDGARWYVFTLHKPSWQLLRAQHDDLDRARYVPFILFPRPDRATEGFSFIGHKLITTIEEHTAWRNMIADKTATIVQAPIKRLQGALWDPMEQPFGPQAVIDVRDMREVEALELPEFGLQHAVQRELNMERTAERLSGINDIASGQVSQESRTLGEIQMATEQSFVRMDLVVRRFQESMEDLFQIRHAIWKRCLAEHPEGYQIPQSMQASLEGRGVQIPTDRAMAQMLEGTFRGKPYGSVQTADPSRRRTNWVQFLQILPRLQQTVPLPNPNPTELARAIWRETLRVFDVENKQAFLGSPAHPAQAQQMAQLMPLLQGLMGMGGPSGLPAGAGASPPAPGLSPPGGPPTMVPGPLGPQ